MEMIYTFTATLDKFSGDLWGLHVALPEEVAQQFKKAGVTRIMCQVAKAAPYHCAIMPLGDGRSFLFVNAAFAKREQLAEGQLLAVKIWKDTSRYGMDMPAELEEMLLQDEQFSTYFHALTPGRQRNLIHFVRSVKSPHIRMRRAVVVCRHLLTHFGKIDFVDLQQEIKEANRMGL